MDFGKADYIFSKNLFKLIKVQSTKNPDYFYQFRRKSCKPCANGPSNEYWSCLSCEQMLKSGRDPNESYCMIRLSNDVIMKDPNAGHHSKCTGVPFGQLHAQILDREARNSCRLGQKRPIDSHIEINNEIEKRFKSPEEVAAVKEHLLGYKSMKSGLKRWFKKSASSGTEPPPATYRRYPREYAQKSADFQQTRYALDNEVDASFQFEQYPSMETFLSPLKLKKMAEQWLEEDTPAFDYGGAIVGDRKAVATLFCKEECMLAGRPFFNAVFEALGCIVEWTLNDGAYVQSTPQIIAKVSGPVRNILLGERSALNCLSRASGIATQCSSLVDICRSTGWQGRLAATRKTTPGFRMVEKYAVIVGGGDSHRYDLSSMVMLKDNHVTACGNNIMQAVEKTKMMAGFTYKVEVESRNEAEAVEAARSGADVVMLDNFSAADAMKTARRLKSEFPSLTIEASGGLNSANVCDYCCEEINVLSMSCLTQGYPCVDFSLKIQ